MVEPSKVGAVIEGTVLRLGAECSTVYPNQVVYFLPSAAVAINGLFVVHEADVFAHEEPDDE